MNPERFDRLAMRVELAPYPSTQVPYVERQAGSGDVPAPEDPEALAASAHELFRRLDGRDAATRAAMASRLGRSVRRDTLIPRRRPLVERALARAMRGRSAEERTRLTSKGVATP